MNTGLRFPDHEKVGDVRVNPFQLERGEWFAGDDWQIYVRIRGSHAVNVRTGESTDLLNKKWRGRSVIPITGSRIEVLRMGHVS